MTKEESDRQPSAAQLIELENMKRARSEGAFVSPCGTEGARWEGFPEWPEPFPYDALGTEGTPDKRSR
ncbi:MAG: hypothetical protein LLG06_04005 [Desulfobacteraceae bacterium]|nr:hypothetical protein [Desulfobacteraceae bacterium]